MAYSIRWTIGLNADGGLRGLGFVDRFARVILGYHGCTTEFASSILSGRTEIKNWKFSTNKWDWLGHGIYFWEHSPRIGGDKLN